MKKIIFSCDGDGCKRTTTRDADDWLSIGTADDTESGLFAKNGLPEHRLISMDNHDDLHFCSKECFYNYFFKLDGKPLTEKENICGVARPSDRELLRRAISNARPERGESKAVRWGDVMRVFGVGSTTAHILCREAGIDPEELRDGSRCEGCPIDESV